jgi:peptide-methionine (S)-S-oxide reductase
VILDVFFSLHDPRQLNRQGNDVGTQYRSAMFYADEDQKQQFVDARDRASEYWDGGLVTTISALGKWTDAEEYHQNFFAKNPGQGYCLAIALPKVNKIRKSYAEYVLAS